MSLNGWYKQTNLTNLSLYQFTNGAQQIIIIKNTLNGLYSGTHLGSSGPVKYTSQDEMIEIWNAHYDTATPLPGKTSKK